MDLSDSAAGPTANHVGAVVLAAGASRRMGARNKLLCEVRGKPMVCWPVDAALDAKLDPVVVVTGHQCQAVESALGQRAVQFALNPRPDLGLSESLKRGMEALDSRVVATFVCLGDMPWITSSHLATLLAAYRPGHAQIVVPQFNGQRGNPVLWDRAHFGALSTLDGDRGGRVLLQRFATHVVPVEMTDSAVGRDVDTPHDLRQIDD